MREHKRRYILKTYGALRLIQKNSSSTLKNPDTEFLLTYSFMNYIIEIVSSQSRDPPPPLSNMMTNSTKSNEQFTIPKVMSASHIVVNMIYARIGKQKKNQPLNFKN